MKILNRTILITGGSRGIGFALAKRLSKMHNRVIICGRDLEQLQSAKNKLGQLEIVQCDLNRDDDLKKLVDEVKTNYGNLSLVINNAGVQLRYI